MAKATMTWYDVMVAEFYAHAAEQDVEDADYEEALADIARAKACLGRSRSRIIKTIAKQACEELDMAASTASVQNAWATAYNLGNAAHTLSILLAVMPGTQQEA